jgi:uncharacterized protein YcfJ
LAASRKRQQQRQYDTPTNCARNSKRSIAQTVYQSIHCALLLHYASKLACSTSIGHTVKNACQRNDSASTHKRNPATDPIFVTSIQAIHIFTGGTWDGEDVTGGKANLIVSSAGFFTGEFFGGHINGVIKLQKN